MKKILIAVCILSMFAISTAGCTKGETDATEASAPTQITTETPTQLPTQPPTETSTVAPTESDTESSTFSEVTVENSTFSVSIVAPIVPETTNPPSSSTDDTSNDTSDDNYTIIDGEWSLSYYEQPNGQHTEAQRSITYIFNDDGTFTVNNNGNIMTGTYTFDGSNLSYTSDASGEQGTFTYNENDKTLIDTDENSEMSAVFIKN